MKEDRENECTLVVIDDVSQMVSSTVVGFTHAHGVMGKIYIAVVT
jgi:hypothetical protein